MKRGPAVLLACATVPALTGCGPVPPSPSPGTTPPNAAGVVDVSVESPFGTGVGFGADTVTSP